MGRENIPMKEEFEKLAAAGKLTRQHVDALVALTESGYCYHRSWGFGKITTVDTVFARFIIDFPGKPGHAMDLAFAAESLKPIPSDHIYARKVSDLDSLRQMAALHHLDLIKLVLQSFGNRATVDQIQQVLVPDVIKDDWKKWWEAAKRELKKDGHFQVPLKKVRPDHLPGQGSLAARPAAGGISRRQGTEGPRHRRARNSEKPVRPGRQGRRGQRSHPRAQRGDRHPSTHAAGRRAGSHFCARRNSRGRRRGRRSKANWPPQPSGSRKRPKSAPFWNRCPPPNIAARWNPSRTANPERWPEALLASLNHVSAKLAAEVAHALIAGGKLDG